MHILLFVIVWMHKQTDIKNVQCPHYSIIQTRGAGAVNSPTSACPHTVYMCMCITDLILFISSTRQVCAMYMPGWS